MFQIKIVRDQFFVHKIYPVGIGEFVKTEFMTFALKFDFGSGFKNDLIFKNINIFES